MDETKKYIIGMVVGELCKNDDLPFRQYEPGDTEHYIKHKIVARADMSAVPTESLKQQKSVYNHELAMALVLLIRSQFSQYEKLVLKGAPPYFDLWVNGDECGMTILTKNPSR